MNTISNILSFIYSGIVTYLMYHWFGQYLMDGFLFSTVVIIALIVIYVAGVVGAKTVYNWTVEKFSILSFIIMIFGAAFGLLLILDGVSMISKDLDDKYLGYDTGNMSPVERNYKVQQKQLTEKLNRNIK